MKHANAYRTSFEFLKEGPNVSEQNKGTVRVAVVVNFLTSYREGFYRQLLATEGVDISIYCHIPPKKLNLGSIHHKFSNNVRLVTGRFLFGEKIVFSRLPWKTLFSKYDVVYVEGNPRYVSLALLATLLRLSGRRVVLKAMVHSFRNSKLGLALRLTWYKIFDQLLVYSDVEANYLVNRGFRGEVVGINNGLDFNEISKAIQAWPESRLVAWQKQENVHGNVLMLSCARLEKKNKFEQIIRAMPELIERYPKLLWCIIGDGSERACLEALTCELNLSSHVRFLGQIYDANEQAPWFLSSRVLAHPGAIGLTLLHAMAFGLPVVTHGNSRRHGPEFAAMTVGVHGLAHDEDATEQMVTSLLKLLGNQKLCFNMGRAGQLVVKEKYNTRVMVQRFLSMLPRQQSDDGKILS